MDAAFRSQPCRFAGSYRRGSHSASTLKSTEACKIDSMPNGAIGVLVVVGAGRAPTAALRLKPALHSLKFCSIAIDGLGDTAADSNRGNEGRFRGERTFKGALHEGLNGR